jgi:nitrate reductase NapE component
MKPPEESGLFPALTDKGVPPERAAEKIQSTRKGWLFVILGAVCIAGGFAFIVWTMIVTKGAPTVALLIFAALPALPGAYFLLAGGHMISGDAMRAAEESGGVLAKTAARALRLARGKE